MFYAKTIADLKARVAELEGLNATATETNSTLTTARDEATASLRKVTADYEQAEASRVELAAKVTELEGKLATRTPEVVAKEVEKGVTATIAAMPIEGALPRGDAADNDRQVPDSAKTADEIIAHYNAMPAGAERFAYYKKHQALLDS